MAFEPQRFIHAANVRLDVPVSVQTSDALTDELRLAFEDATLTSFEDVIQGCIARQVDYLLLSGNVFVEADRSLRARLALLNGFRQLEAKQIRVFVVPGDADPAEAWRSIPEMPANVRVCYSSDPEPVELQRNDRVIATISSSMWYGETDAFGIRVIAESADGIHPLRIGIISKLKYAEAQRMAQLASTASEDLVAVSSQNSAIGELADDVSGSPRGTLVPLSGKPKKRIPESPDLSDLEDEESGILPGVPPEGAHSGDHRTDEDEPDSNHEWDDGFLQYIDETLREGRLNYLALTGELKRSILRRPAGVVHCPGTTQPRNHHEVTSGSCSLVEVNADGRVLITALDTSSVDWKTVEIHVASQTTLSSMLQSMKTRLLQQTAGPSDRIWSVHWKLRCSIPVLKELVQDDLAVAVAVELDEIRISDRTIRLLHNVQLIPNAWQLDDSKLPAQRFADIVESPEQWQPENLLKLIETERDLSAGWRQRLTALVAGVDTQQILAHLRVDGAGWFIPDLSILESEAAEDSELADDLDDESDDREADGSEDEDDAQFSSARDSDHDEAVSELKNTADDEGSSSVYEDEGTDDGDREGDAA